MQLQSISLFDDLWGDPFNGTTPVAGTTDDEGNFTFSLDVPGIPAEAISCELLEDLLTVKGAHEGRSLDRSYRVNAEEVSAQYANGVLKLTLKATPKQKPLQIPVTAG